MSNAIILGVEYTDRITGFKGTATGFCTYISGCNQALLSPPVSPDGALRDAAWFDAQRLEPNACFAPIKLDNGATPGCDKPAPIR